MTSPTRVSVIIALSLAALTCAGLGGAAIAAEPATTFAADAPAAAAAAPADGAEGMLRNCDAQLEACQADAVGVPYLVWAYMALWVILFVFLIMARSGQKKLRIELEELRERLSALQERQP